MNEFIIPNFNFVSNAFSKRRTDFDAQEREIAEFIKKVAKSSILIKSRQRKWCAKLTPAASIKIQMPRLDCCYRIYKNR